MVDARMGFTPAIPRTRSTRIEADPALLRIGVAVILSLLLTLPALLLDGRMFQGENVWVKPIKFQIALAVYLVTLAVFASFLPKDAATTRRLRWIGVALTLATVAELIWIGGSAMFATASHYNTHPLLYAIYALMGGLATVLILGSLMMGLSFWSDRDSHLPEALRLSLALGLILTFALTLPAAGTLSAMSGHFIGTPVTGAVVPVMGWSREVGDLRVAHFLATHALHVVPLIGVAAMGLTSPALACGLVWAGALGYAALTAFAFVQALAGQPAF
jgi:hypothetical protein